MVGITIETQSELGPLALWRHSVGHGGINPLPLPERVVQGTAALRPRLIRIFIQEFFRVYPDHDRFDWSRLDPYMDALARTGANVIAAITIPTPALSSPALIRSMTGIRASWKYSKYLTLLTWP